MPLEELIQKILQLSKREFSRLRLMDFEADTISTDCMGLIYLLMHHQKVVPPEINESSKVKDLFSVALKRERSQLISSIQKHDLLLWKKDNPPRSGDTGHVLVVMQAPLEISTNQYRVKILEVSRFSQGPVLREIVLHTSDQAQITAVQWDPESKKVKRTQIIAFTPFSSLRRSLCENCRRSTKTCLCPFLPKEPWIKPPFQIIQDKREKKVALRSCQILELCFEDPNELYTEPEEIDQKAILVYPSQQATMLETQEDFTSLQGRNLLLLDGSWKQVKGMLLKNPKLSELKQIQFKRSDPSLYKIRKAPSEEHYSTLESFSYLWSKVYPEESPKAQQLNIIFSKMIEKQIELMGRDTFEKNYAHYPGYSS